MNLYQVDSFTRELFTGNPAGVVTGAETLTDEEMQLIARELNCSETAFVLPPRDDTHQVWIRYFTPTVEVPICGHATVAAHFVRALEDDLRETTVVDSLTGVGVLPVTVSPKPTGYRVTMVQGAFAAHEPLDGDVVARIYSALGTAADRADPRFPVQVVSTGHSKVMVGLRTIADVDALTPDLRELAALSAEIGCNGYFAFTLDGPGDCLTYGRMFAPAIGIDEDPVTGNANGPLGGYLVHHGLVVIGSSGERTFRAAQGAAVNRPGHVDVTVTRNSDDSIGVQITGDAVLVFKSTLMLQEPRPQHVL